MIMHTKEEKMQAFGRFLDVLDALRANCPWEQEADERESETQYDRRDLRTL